MSWAHFRSNKFTDPSNLSSPTESGTGPAREEPAAHPRGAFDDGTVAPLGGVRLNNTMGHLWMVPFFLALDLWTFELLGTLPPTISLPENLE